MIVVIRSNLEFLIRFVRLIREEWKMPVSVWSEAACGVSSAREPECGTDARLQPHPCNTKSFLHEVEDNARSHLAMFEPIEDLVDRREPL